MENLEKKVIVHFERGTNTLTIDPAEVRVGNREWVRWEFEGLRENEFGFISFAPPLPRLGPFYSLRTFTPRSFLGKGNKGAAVGDAYGYRALLLDLDDPEAKASAVGMIINTATEENTAPEIHVTYHGDANPPFLEVNPFQVGLNTGDTAIWHFDGLPANSFVCFRFDNEDLGPFIAFSACNGEDDCCTVEASGTGFAVAERFWEIEQFHYHIELRDWAGRRLASHDPQIDNLGPPPVPEP